MTIYSAFWVFISPDRILHNWLMEADKQIAADGAEMPAWQGSSEDATLHTP